MRSDLDFIASIAAETATMRRHAAALERLTVAAAAKPVRARKAPAPVSLYRKVGGIHFIRAFGFSVTVCRARKADRQPLSIAGMFATRKADRARSLAWARVKVAAMGAAAFLIGGSFAIALGLFLGTAFAYAGPAAESYALTGFANGSRYVLDSGLTESDCQGELAVALETLKLAQPIGGSVGLACEPQ